MKRFFACLLVLVLLCALTCSTAVALTAPDMGGGKMLPPGMNPPPAGPFTITGVVPYQLGDTYYNPVTLPSDKPLTGLLQSSLPCSAVDGEDHPLQGGYFCPVTWELADQTTLTTPGRTTIYGTLTPEAGYTLAEGVSPQVQQSVVVTGGEPEILAQVSASFSPVTLLALGKVPQGASSDATCFTTNPGEYFFCPIRWDYSGVKQDTPGTYPITGTLELPVDFAPPLDLAPFTRSVMVMDGTKVDLSAASFDPSTNQLVCHWLYHIPDDIPVKLEYAIGKGPWQPDESNYLSYNCYADSLQVNLNHSNPKFELKTDYYFRIVYGPQDQQITSNVLHVRLENWDFLGSEGAAPSFDIGGDRDGGDQGGGELPDLVQPAPTPDHEEGSDDASPVLERVTETSTTLSGARLSQLTAGGGTVLFEKQGVAVELSATFLEMLGLQDRQLLEVSIQRSTPDTFHLALHADGQEITKLPDTVVRLPKSKEEKDSPLECINEAGLHVSDATYEQENKMVRCTISATGTYRIQAVPTPAEPPQAPMVVPATETAAQPPKEPSTVAVTQEPTAAAAAQPALQSNPPAAVSHPEGWILLAGASLLGAGWLLHRRRPRG